jgi:hypothetical protein
MPFTAAHDVTAEDVARAARLAMRTRDKFLGIGGGLIMVAVEVLVAYAFAIYVAAIVKSPAMLIDLLRFETGDLSTSLVTWLSVIITLLLPVFFFYTGRTLVESARPDWRVRRLVKGSDMLGPTTYTIDNEGVRSTKAAGSDVFLPWATFDGLRTDADLAVLTRKGQLRFFVPLQAFARDRDDVVTHLTSRVRSAA